MQYIGWQAVSSDWYDTVYRLFQIVFARLLTISTRSSRLFESFRRSIWHFLLLEQYGRIHGCRRRKVQKSDWDLPTPTKIQACLCSRYTDSLRLRNQRSWEWPYCLLIPFWVGLAPHSAASNHVQAKQILCFQWIYDWTSDLSLVRCLLMRLFECN